jgi:hypothetical protein
VYPIPLFPPFFIYAGSAFYVIIHLESILFSAGGIFLSRKKEKQVQAASVDVGKILLRDLQNTALWVGIAWMVVVVIAVIYG